jgi:hypothetical protein
VSAQQPTARAREPRTPAARAVQRAAAGGKLTPDDVRTIRAMIARGFEDWAIAEDYQVTPRMIGHIRTRSRWGSVT